MASLSIVSPNPNPTVVFSEPHSLEMFSSGTDCSGVTIKLIDVTGSPTEVPAPAIVVMQSVLDPDTATIYIPANTLQNNKLYRLEAKKSVRTEAEETKPKAKKRATAETKATVYLDTR